jgi:hypothetical protein
MLTAAEARLAGLPWQPYEPYAEYHHGGRRAATPRDRIECVLVGVQCGTISPARALVLIGMIQEAARQ